MEPLRGGDLVGRLSPRVRHIWDSIRPKRPPVEWVLSWLWDQPEVSMVLSGMNAMEQLEQNAAIASRSRVGAMTPDQRSAISRVRAAYHRERRIGCTNCGYCLPCPSGVNIPRNFGVYNDQGMFPESPTAGMIHNEWMDAGSRASACIECGECLDRCPQQIPIPERLKEVDKALARK